MKVTVLGGLGRLGLWITKFLLDNRFEVTVSTPNTEKYKDQIKKLDITVHSNNKDAVKDADIIIVSVPLNKTIEVLKEILPYLKENSVVVEVASIKRAIADFLVKNKTYLNSKGIKFLSLHPMFGPGASSLSNQNVIIVKSENSKTIIEKTKDFLKRNNANIVLCSYDEHDQKIAYALGIPHFTIILFASLISGSSDLEDLKKYAGTTFKTLNLLSESLLNESWELYSHIQIDNSYFKKILEEYKEKFNELYKIISESDFNKFKKFWEENILPLKSAVSEGEASKKIYDLVEKI
ncbi:MAG: prephenate dehydrogenase/arogenate dehydrogenase family protein [Candidatus Odinarchaeia archaeon]